MKKAVFSLGVILILSTLTACKSENDITAVKNGTYVLELTGTEDVMLPSVAISDDNISFTYDILSSYIPIGTYTIEHGILTMVTSDGKYKYVFQIDGDKLVFQEKGSSAVILTDDRFGIKVTDNAEFKLKENS